MAQRTVYSSITISCGVSSNKSNRLKKLSPQSMCLHLPRLKITHVRSASAFSQFQHCSQNGTVGCLKNSSYDAPLLGTQQECAHLSRSGRKFSPEINPLITWVLPYTYAFSLVPRVFLLQTRAVVDAKHGGATELNVSYCKGAVYVLRYT